MSEEMKEPLLNQIHGLMGSNSKNSAERAIQLFSSTNSECPYPKNVIVSSRYTAFNFLPKSLLEQFRRLANVYFLVIGIIALIGSETSAYESALDPAAILFPMLIVVLISVAKDGLEDWKRHKQDAKINAKLSHRVAESSGAIFNIEWKELKVGDTVVIFSDEEIPADVVVLACGGVQGPTAYVETAAIDGETNLKLKTPCLMLSEEINSHHTAANTVTLLESKAGVIGLPYFV